nr:hypothetical protein [Propionibacterium sp.]
MPLLTRLARPLTSLAAIVAIGGSALVATAPEADAADTRQAFISRVAPAALASQQRTGVPASVTIAQAILESGWGQSQLTRRANNYFGIKCTAKASPTQRGCVALSTAEYVRGRRVTVVARFRAYANAQGSFEDHARLLASRYRSAMAVTHHPETFARRLQSAGYATDPRYATRLIALMRQYRLDRYDTTARVATPSVGASTVPAAARGWIVDRHAPAARVRVLQSALRAHGLPVAVTGRWDAATLRAVQQFQRSHGLRADGVAGPRTWALL